MDTNLENNEQMLVEKWLGEGFSREAIALFLACSLREVAVEKV